MAWTDVLQQIADFVKNNAGSLIQAGGEIAGPLIGQQLANAGIGSSQNWQEAMRATTYQVMVGDLAKAGLNPALAFGKGSASPAGVPAQGAVPYAGAAGTLGAIPGRVLSNALQASKASAEIDTARAVRDKAVADATKAQSDARYADQLNENASVNLTALSAKNWQDAKVGMAAEREVNARTLSTDINRMLSETKLPGARREQALDEAEYGEIMRAVNRAGVLAPIINTIIKLRR